MGKSFWRFFVSILVLCGTKAWAEPYLAAWKGVNCNACHINQTGGWIRNDFGKNYGNSLATFDWQGLSEAVQTVKHNTPSWVSVGVDIHQGYGANFFPNGPVGTPSSQNSFMPGRQALEVAIKANEAISGVISQWFDGGAIPKEIYGMVSGLPEGAYLKFGTFTTPFGLELADETSLVRSSLLNVLSFDWVNSPGVEAGIYPGPVFLNAAVFGNDGGSPVAERSFAARGGFNFSEITFGGSIYGDNLDMHDATEKLRYNAFGWGKVGPVVLLGEFDSGYSNSGLAQDNFTAYHGSAEFDLGSSVYLRLTSEMLKDSLTSGYNGFRHLVSVRCYPVHNFKFQLDLQRYDPSAGTPSYNANGPSFYGLLADAFIFY